MASKFSKYINQQETDKQVSDVVVKSKFSKYIDKETVVPEKDTIPTSPLLSEKNPFISTTTYPKKETVTQPTSKLPTPTIGFPNAPTSQFPNKYASTAMSKAPVETKVVENHLDNTLKTVQNAFVKFADNFKPKVTENVLFGPLAKPVAEITSNVFSSLLKTPALTVADSVNRIDEFNRAIGGGYTQDPKNPTASIPNSLANKVGKGIELGVGAANVAFIPITSVFEAAKQLPVVDLPVKGIEWVFGKTGELGSYAGNIALDNLPISDQEKETLRQPITELLSLIGMVVLGGTLFKGAKRGIEEAKIYNALRKEGTPEYYNAVIQKLGSLPTENLMNEAMSKVESKVVERTSKGIKLTPEEGKKITDEVSKEVLTIKEPIKAVAIPKPIVEAPKQPVAEPKAEFKTIIPTEQIKIPKKTVETELLTKKPTIESPKPKIETKKIEEITETKKPKDFKSRVYQRLKEDNPETLVEDVSYEGIKLKEDAEKAVSLIEKDKQQAYRVAMNREEAPKGQTSTAINIALSEKALDEGNIDLYGKLIKSRSLAQTKRGQELVAEKGSISNNTTSRYVKELINDRLNKLGSRYTSNLKETKKKAIEKIDKEVKKMEDKIKNKNLDIKTALELLDKITCV
jgi:hypothetical protein